MTENGNEMHENEEEDSQELMETQLNTNQDEGLFSDEEPDNNGSDEEVDDSQANIATQAPVHDLHGEKEDHEEEDQMETQAVDLNINAEDHDDNDQETQAVDPIDETSKNVEDKILNKKVHDSDDGLRSRSISPSREVNARKSLSRSTSRSASRSRSRSVSMDRSRSISSAGSRSRSRSGAKSRSLSAASSRSRSVARSRPGSRASRSLSSVRSRSGSRSKSRSVSIARSRSNSAVRSKSRSLSASSSRSGSVLPTLSRTPSPVAGSRSKSRSRSSSIGRPDSPAVNRKRKIDSEAESDTEEAGGSKNKDIERRDDSDDDIRMDEEREQPTGWDFDIMMKQKKAENGSTRRHKKKDIDVINDNDDAIAKLIADMRIAAKEDRDLNLKGKPATKKMGMFRHVMQNLKKVELQMAFVEANLLSVMTDWLAPMPDKSLPHIEIRAEFLRLLRVMKIEDVSRLKESGIGKALMYLYRHPREERENKDCAGYIINEWARPIFKKETDMSRLTKDERREKDAEMAIKLGRKKKKKDDTEEAPKYKPGDQGWVARARVPMVDNAEYVNRPEWQTTVHVQDKKTVQKINMLEKHKRKFAERARLRKNLTLATLSLEGARVPLGQ